MRPAVDPHRRTRGVTLLELVIAVFVLSIGTVAAFRTIDHARRNIGGELDRLFAQQVALNRAEELRLLGAKEGPKLPARVEYGPHVWEIEVAEKATLGGFIEATVTARSAGRPAGLAVAFIREGRAQ